MINFKDLSIALNLHKESFNYLDYSKNLSFSRVGVKTSIFKQLRNKVRLAEQDRKEKEQMVEKLRTLVEKQKQEL